MRTISFVLLLIAALNVMASTSKLQREMYEKVPISLRKYLPLICLNAYNALDDEQRGKVTEIAKNYHTTEDKNQFLSEIVAVSSTFAKQIIFLHHIRNLAVAAEPDEEQKEKIRHAADAAFNLGVAFLSGDEAHQKKAQAEADLYKN